MPITDEASLSRAVVEESPSLRRQLGEGTPSRDFEIIEQRAGPASGSLELEPAFVKVDVQGFEQPVREGVRRTLERTGPPVLVEAPTVKTITYMASLGYGAYAYRHGERRLLPLDVVDRTQLTNVMFAVSIPS